MAHLYVRRPRDVKIENLSKTVDIRGHWARVNDFNFVHEKFYRPRKFTICAAAAEILNFHVSLCNFNANGIVLPPIEGIFQFKL